MATPTNPAQNPGIQNDQAGNPQQVAGAQPSNQTQPGPAPGGHQPFSNATDQLPTAVSAELKEQDETAKQFEADRKEFRRRFVTNHEWKEPLKPEQEAEIVRHPFYNDSAKLRLALADATPSPAEPENTQKVSTENTGPDKDVVTSTKEKDAEHHGRRRSGG